MLGLQGVVLYDENGCPLEPTAGGLEAICGKLEDILDVLSNGSIEVTPGDGWDLLFDGLGADIVASIEAQTEDITDALQAICDKLDAGITVNAVQSGTWDVTVDGEVALDTDTIQAIADAIGDADLTVTIGGQDVTLDVNITNEDLTVTLSQDSLDALEDITVMVEIKNEDPIEITGEVTIDGDVSVDWTGMQDALNGLEVEITNFADLVDLLEDATLTVTIDGEVTIDQDQIDSIIDAIKDVVRVDYEPIDFCVFDADGNVIPSVQIFREKKYNDAGNVVSDSTVLSQFDIGTSAWTAYTPAGGETVGKCPSEKISDHFVDGPCSEGGTEPSANTWTLFSKFPNPHPDAASYPGITHIGSLVAGGGTSTHPGISSLSSANFDPDQGSQWDAISVSGGVATVTAGPNGTGSFLEHMTNVHPQCNGDLWLGRYGGYALAPGSAGNPTLAEGYILLSDGNVSGSSYTLGAPVLPAGLTATQLEAALVSGGFTAAEATSLVANGHAGTDVLNTPGVNFINGVFDAGAPTPFGVCISAVPQSINGWNVFAMCSETQPADDSNGHFWMQGAPSSFAATLQYETGPSGDPDCGDAPVGGETEQALPVTDKCLYEKMCELIDAVNNNTPIDYTSILNGILAATQAVDANTDTVEALLATINTTLGTLDSDDDGTALASILTSINNAITELQAIDANTDTLEALLTALATTVTTEGDQTQAILTQILNKMCTDTDTPLTQVSGTGNVPAGLKSVTIKSTAGGTLVDGVYPLNINESISFGTDRGNCINELLPAIALTGGARVWVGLRD